VLGATKEGKPVKLTVTFDPFNKAQVLPASASVSVVVLKADPVIDWPAPAPVLTKDICTPLEAEKFAMPPFTPATNHAPLPPIAGVDSVAPAGPE
jgi:hypothetical protein